MRETCMRNKRPWGFMRSRHGGFAGHRLTAEIQDKNTEFEELNRD